MRRMIASVTVAATLAGGCSFPPGERPTLTSDQITVPTSGPLDAECLDGPDNPGAFKIVDGAVEVEVDARCSGTDSEHPTVNIFAEPKYDLSNTVGLLQHGTEVRVLLMTVGDELSDERNRKNGNWLYVTVMSSEENNSEVEEPITRGWLNGINVNWIDRAVDPDGQPVVKMADR